jgi:hypothetical protein
VLPHSTFLALVTEGWLASSGMLRHLQRLNFWQGCFESLIAALPWQDGPALPFLLSRAAAALSAISYTHFMTEVAASVMYSSKC